MFYGKSTQDRLATGLLKAFLDELQADEKRVKSPPKLSIFVKTNNLSENIYIFLYIGKYINGHIFRRVFTRSTPIQ